LAERPADWKVGAPSLGGTPKPARENWGQVKNAATIACRRGGMTYRRFPNLLPGQRPGKKARNQAWALKQTWKSAVRQQALRLPAGAAA
jgi:hypothetical protein